MPKPRAPHPFAAVIHRMFGHRRPGEIRPSDVKPPIAEKMRAIEEERSVPGFEHLDPRRGSGLSWEAEKQRRAGLSDAADKSPFAHLRGGS